MSKPTIAEEHFARLIAFWHGQKIVGRYQGEIETIASRAGYGVRGYSAERYADARWQEYVGAAQAVIEVQQSISGEHP